MLMGITDAILNKVAKLPESAQTEVLDFVDFLSSKNAKETPLSDEEWSSLSLSTAMRGMEEEEEITYTLDDLQEKFS